jgi:hypothetical protein
VELAYEVTAWSNAGIGSLGFRYLKLKSSGEARKSNKDTDNFLCHDERATPN